MLSVLAALPAPPVGWGGAGEAAGSLSWLSVPAARVVAVAGLLAIVVAFGAAPVTLLSSVAVTVPPHVRWRAGDGGWLGVEWDSQAGLGMGCTLAQPSSCQWRGGGWDAVGGCAAPAVFGCEGVRDASVAVAVCDFGRGFLLCLDSRSPTPWDGGSYCGWVLGRARGVRWWCADGKRRAWHLQGGRERGAGAGACHCTFLHAACVSIPVPRSTTALRGSALVLVFIYH